MSHDDVLALLRRKVEEAGGQTRFAEANGLHQGHVSCILRGYQKPGPMVLTVLGLKIVRTYEPVK